MTVLVHALEKPGLAPFAMPDRFRTEIAYFISVDDKAPPPGEYHVRAVDVASWLDEGVFRLVSPLDSASQAEIELTEEQESWLEWMQANQIERIRISVD
ncbi:MAG: hypothetical protein JNL96_16995 [Planctomycetaceae bacterium]|nr:hypothetical protein [Planctomycetaceae bacterium]